MHYLIAAPIRDDVKRIHPPKRNIFSASCKKNTTISDVILGGSDGFDIVHKENDAQKTEVP